MVISFSLDGQVIEARDQAISCCVSAKGYATSSSAERGHSQVAVFVCERRGIFYSIYFAVRDITYSSCQIMLFIFQAQIERSAPALHMLYHKVCWYFLVHLCC